MHSLALCRLQYHGVCMSSCGFWLQQIGLQRYMFTWFGGCRLLGTMQCGYGLFILRDTDNTMRNYEKLDQYTNGKANWPKIFQKNTFIRVVRSCMNPKRDSISHRLPSTFLFCLNREPEPTIKRTAIIMPNHPRRYQSNNDDDHTTYYRWSPCINHHPPPNINSVPATTSDLGSNFLGGGAGRGGRHQKRGK